MRDDMFYVFDADTPGNRLVSVRVERNPNGTFNATFVTPKCGIVDYTFTITQDVR